MVGLLAAPSPLSRISKRSGSGGSESTSSNCTISSSWMVAWGWVVIPQGINELLQGLVLPLDFNPHTIRLVGDPSTDSCTIGGVVDKGTKSDALYNAAHGNGQPPDHVCLQAILPTSHSANSRHPRAAGSRHFIHNRIGRQTLHVRACFFDVKIQVGKQVCFRDEQRVAAVGRLLGT